MYPNMVGQLQQQNNLTKAGGNTSPQKPGGPERGGEEPWDSLLPPSGGELGSREVAAWSFSPYQWGQVAAGRAAQNHSDTDLAGTKKHHKLNTN